MPRRREVAVAHEFARVEADDRAFEGHGGLARAAARWSRRGGVFGQWKPLGPTARGAGARAAELARRWGRAVADALQACAQPV